MSKQAYAATVDAVTKFSKFMDEDTDITNFLKVGLSLREILNHYKKENGIKDIEKIDYNAFYRFLNSMNNGSSILRNNARETVETLGGKKFEGANDLVIYYRKGNSSATRVLFEMKNSGADLYSLKILDVFDKSKNMTRKEIAEEMSKRHKYEKSNVYSNMNTFIPRLRKTNLITEKNTENSIAYSLSERVAPYFSAEVRGAWEKLKVWPHRIKFYE